MTQLNYKILIVDDNPAFIKAFTLIIKNVLKTKIELIDNAYNGLEALEKVNAMSYNYIFMDVNMPEMDGKIATKIINNEYNRFSKIIAVSFNNDMTTITDMIKAGARGYLNKANITFEEVAKLFENDVF